MATVKIIRPEDKKIVTLWLDSYDDIFSDFDPRSYSQRNLSEDFLTESKKVAHEYKPGELDLTLLIPNGKRDMPTEKIIKSRLHSYFKKKDQQMNEESKETRRKGGIFTLLGVICMVTAAFLLHLGSTGYLMSLFIIILEPAGWFLAWNGMDHILFMSKANKPERDFAKKMTRAEILFEAYSNK